MDRKKRLIALNHMNTNQNPVKGIDMTSKDEAIKLAIQWFEWYFDFSHIEEPSHNSTYVYDKLREAVKEIKNES
jgi:hypothetical protein